MITAMVLPSLLPAHRAPPTPHPHEWTPSRYISEPSPPPVEEGKIFEVDPRTTTDGKMFKKTRPRRTVDYNGGMGRWINVSRGCVVYCGDVVLSRIALALYCVY